MKRTLFFLICTHFFLIGQLLYAMEIKKDSFPDMQSLIIKRIKIPYATCIRYLNNNSVVVAYNQSCSIIDIKTGIEIKKISEPNIPCFSFKMDPKKKRIALSDYETINIYDMKTGTLEWSKQKNNYMILNVDFGPYDNTVCLRLRERNTKCSAIIKYNYLDKFYSDGNIVYINHDGNCSGYIDFAHHPKKEILCVVEGCKVLLYDSSNLKLKPKKIELPHGSHSCQISSEDFFAVMNNYQDEISIINLHDQNTCNYLKTEKNEKFTKILFYFGSVLVTISQSLGLAEYSPIMRYWDAKTLQLIYAIQLSNSGIIWDIAFSPNGEEVVFGFDKECVRCLVPFEVRYERGTKEKFPYLLLVLNYHIEHLKQHGLLIPVDITRLIAHTCLEAFRR
jgi:WD40 repeat protein